MMKAENVKTQIEQTLAEAGLLDLVDKERSQYLDMPDGPSIELVIRDAGRQGDILQALSDLCQHVDLAVHPQWAIEIVGEPDLARSSLGNIVLATAVPVTLQSGSSSASVQVVVTHLAEQEMEKLIGAGSTTVLARAYVESLLRWGGRSYWDPTRRTRLEIDRARALALYGTLKKSA